ncbi:10885_t:CDS:2 [Gigaspora rosea]|nr:10885_t:CDS:2 [Gigaspora rosea]
MDEYQYKEVPVLLPNSIPSTPSICYDLGFNNEEPAEWYSYLDFGTLELEVDEVASDADDIIDEVNRQFKIKRKKDKLLSIRCYADEAGNTYLQEALGIENLPVNDLFDYFYEERQEPHQIGQLESKQHFCLQQFIGNNLDLFIWGKGPLGQTNLVKHRIETGSALLIRQYPY